jgi:hypothetical protein
MAPIQHVGAFAAAARADVLERDLAVTERGPEALLIPLEGDRFRIAVDPTPRSGWQCRPSGERAPVARHRFRFRVAHELGHTFFYSRCGDRRPSRVSRGSSEEEMFCDRFARALLLPDAVLEKCTEVSTLAQVHRDYGVSLEVTVRAFAEIRKMDAALFYWPPESTSPRVQWSNLEAREGRLGKWRSTLARTLSSAADKIVIASAEAALFPESCQAAFFANR